jgi:hypothetical protein
MGWQRPSSQQPGVPPYAPPPMMGSRPGVRPAGVTAISIIQIVLGSFLVLTGSLLGVFLTQSMYDEVVSENPEAYEDFTYDDLMMFGYIMLIIGIILIVPAVFMLRRENWARIASMVVFGVLGGFFLLEFLLIFDVTGIIVAAAAGISIYYLNKPEIKEYFRKQPDPLYRSPDQLYK